MRLHLVRGSGERADGHQERVQGYVFEEADLQPDGDDLAEVCRDPGIFSARAQIGQGEVAGTGQFQTRRHNGGIKIKDGAKLDLNPEFYGAGRERLSVDNPASAVGKRSCEMGKNALTFFVAEALDVQGLHGIDNRPCRGYVPIGCSSVRGGDCVTLFQVQGSCDEEDYRQYAHPLCFHRHVTEFCFCADRLLK